MSPDDNRSSRSNKYNYYNGRACKIPARALGLISPDQLFLEENITMGKQEEIKTTLIQCIIEDARENHKEKIDKAYEYFWDENAPDEFLSGTALELGFINFEDWLLCDYKNDESKETLLDLHVKCKKLSEEDMEVVSALKNSVLSLYEVVSVSKDKRVLVKDLLIGGEFSLKEKILTRGLKKGDIFATRLLHLDKKHVMSGCVYPFRPDQKKAVLEYVDKQFRRYRKNVNPEGTISDYLKNYGDIFNLIWINFFLDSQKPGK